MFPLLLLLQYLLQQYMELYEKMLKSESTIHFIETSSSLLHNAPYIDTIVRDYDERQIDIPVKDEIQLVYGLQGDHLLLLWHNTYIIH